MGPRIRGGGNPLDEEFELEDPTWAQDVRRVYEGDDESDYDDDTTHDLDCPGGRDCICVDGVDDD